MQWRPRTTSVPCVIVFLVLGPLVVLAMIAVVLVGVRRKKPRTGLGLRLTAPRSDGTRGLIGGSWNAMIHAESVFGAMGGTLGAQQGRFELSAGALSFLPDGAEQPAWTVPCTSLGVARGFTRPVRLEGPMGTIHCTVSTEHINVLTQNPLKDVREQGYATEFVTALQSAGARPA